ncbi:glycosyltransferase family 4 protein [bacterium]|nr:glycosyltransferase family 4 protein [bacterium]
MRSFLVNFICLFIRNKRLRDKVRYNLKKKKKSFYDIGFDVDKKNLSSRNLKKFNDRILLINHDNFLRNDAGNCTYLFKIITELKSMGFKIDFLSSAPLKCFDTFEELNKKYKYIDNLFLPAMTKIKSHSKFNYSKSFWGNNEFISLFQDIIKNNDYSYIFANYINYSDLFRFTNLNPNTKIVNLLHDFNTLQHFFHTYNNFNMGVYFEEEVKLFQYYDDVLCISYDEKALFEKFYPNKRFHWLPFFSESKDVSGYEKDIDLLFVGFCNIYNYNSILWFYDNVFPKLKNVKLVVCGKVSKMIRDNNPSIYKQMEKDNIKFYDYVENLDDLYFKTKIAIVPMFGGTGLKVKTVTAMSYGIPVCGTMSACDGFLDKTENGCLLTDDAVEFANNINKLLNDKEFYEQVSRKEQEYFKKYFSVERAKRILKDVFNG